MSKRASWLSDTPAPDVQVMTKQELLTCWSENRNSTMGVMAAEEMMRRLMTETNLKETQK